MAGEVLSTLDFEVVVLLCGVDTVVVVRLRASCHAFAFANASALISFLLFMLYCATVMHLLFIKEDQTYFGRQRMTENFHAVSHSHSLTYPPSSRQHFHLFSRYPMHSLFILHPFLRHIQMLMPIEPRFNPSSTSIPLM